MSAAHGHEPAPVPQKPALTKIVATLGPATDSLDAVVRLIQAGVSVFRLNFSHGSFEEHAGRLALVRRASAQAGRAVAALGDLCGPKIRVGKMSKPVELAPGQDVLIDPALRDATGGPTPALPCTYTPIAREVSAGQRVLINDGAIRMLAVDPMPASDTGRLRCRVTVGGTVSSGKGINLPDSSISAPALTEFDRECVAWALEHDLDALALSFVRSAEDVGELRLLLAAAARGVGPKGDARGWCAMSGPIPVIAKIEKPQAVDRLEEILRETDGVMVARGDLGVELDVARVPVIQKRMVALAQRFGKPCIVATQMLETMIDKATPTRAEASDVANAILDGADAVMLSAETAVGKHPDLVVETMRRIALVAEERLAEVAPPPETPPALRQAHEVAAALAHGAWTIADDCAASLIVVWSEGGETARRLSHNRFRVPILAFSSDEVAVRRMALLRGVFPVLAPSVPGHRSEFAEMVDRYAIEHGWVRRGQTMVLLGGKPFGQRNTTNTIAVRVAGELWGGDA